MTKSQRRKFQRLGQMIGLLVAYRVAGNGLMTIMSFGWSEEEPTRLLNSYVETRKKLYGWKEDAVAIFMTSARITYENELESILARFCELERP